MYAAPEIIRKKNYDGQMADIWSLGIQKFILFVVYFYFVLFLGYSYLYLFRVIGVMLFTMVTGHLPWRPSNSNPENYFSI